MFAFFAVKKNSSKYLKKYPSDHLRIAGTVLLCRSCFSPVLGHSTTDTVLVQEKYL